MKSVGAVVAGFVFVVVTSTAMDALMHGTGVFPPMGHAMATGLWVWASVYRFAFTVGGAYLAATLAPKNAMSHAMVLGCVGLVAGIVGVVTTWNEGPGFGPKWYPIGLVVAALPGTWLGGKLFERRK